ncbi:MAG: amidase [Pseudomonadota bacterium]
MPDDFDARLEASRLPLDDDERTIMRDAVSRMGVLIRHLDDPAQAATTDPLDGWSAPRAKAERPTDPDDGWPMPTVAAMADALKNGRTTARDLTELCLDRIEHHDGPLSSFLTVTADHARRSAEAADVELRRGRRRGPLHGIPYALKDAFDTAGIRTTVGSRVFADRVPTKDAALVADLNEAGAVLIGKLDTTEFCLGGPSRDGGFGPANNPWDLPRYAGGSSSGAGAAIAAGLIPLAFGTDTGGSVRLPATLTGVAGLKPTQGLISTDGVFPLARSLDHAGPLAATAYDCTLALEAIGKLERGAADPPAAAGLRIGIPRGHGADCPSGHPNAVRALFTAASAMVAAGAEIRTVDLPALWSYSAASSIIVGHEGWQVHAKRLAKCGRAYASMTRLRLGVGAFVSDKAYGHAMRVREQLTAAWQAAFADIDVMLTIGSPGPAPLQTAVAPFYYFDSPILFSAANIAGAPALVVRVGTSEGGLPIGVQLAGRRGDDGKVLGVGQLLERLLQPSPRHPAGYGGPNTQDSL